MTAFFPTMSFAIKRTISILYCGFILVSRARRSRLACETIGSSQQGRIHLHELGLGLAVQISAVSQYAVIRWIGELPRIQGPVAGVELVSCVVKINPPIKLTSNTTHSQDDYTD